MYRKQTLFALRVKALVGDIVLSIVCAVVILAFSGV